MAKKSNAMVKFEHDESVGNIPEFEIRDLYKLIGQGYENYWWFPGRYAVCKGS